MTPSGSSGSLLRAWRIHEGMTQDELAAQLFVTPASVSAWETGVRRIARHTLLRLDDEWDARGCLVDLVRAIGTPQGYPEPRRYWPHVFPQDSGPIWIWIRSPAGGDPSGRFHAGPNGVVFASPREDGRKSHVRGLFLTVGLWDRRWPMHVMLDEPGWVDFGRGVLPPWLNGPARVAKAVADIELVDPQDREVGYFLARMRRLDRGDPATLGTRMRELFGAERYDRYTRAWQIGGAQGGAPSVTGKGTEPSPPATPAARREVHHRLRVARGMSRADAAAAVSALVHAPATPVTEDHIYNYESGRRSRVRHLPAMLDVVYDAGGWTCHDVVDPQREGPGVFRVDLPAFWVGPITIDVGPDEAYNGDARFDITSLWWHNESPLGPGARRFTYAVTMRQDPLRITVPAARTVQVHLGHSPRAVDLNRHWVPTEQRADEIFDDYLTAFLTLVGKTRADLDRALAGVAE